MRKALSTSVLVLALCYSAQAGDIPSPPGTPTPPPAANGEIHTGAAESEDTLTGIALDLLRSVLTLF